MTGQLVWWYHETGSYTGESAWLLCHGVDVIAVLYLDEGLLKMGTAWQYLDEALGCQDPQAGMDAVYRSCLDEFLSGGGGDPIEWAEWVYQAIDSAQVLGPAQGMTR